MAKRLRMNAAEITEKQSRRLKASIPDIKAGVLAVTDSPMEAAIAQEDKMLANLTESIVSGKWRRGLERVGLPFWKTQTAEKGTIRIAAGIDGAKAKQEKFYAELIPHIQAGQDLVADMPTMTLDEGIAKSAAFIRHMAEFKRS